MLEGVGEGEEEEGVGEEDLEEVSSAGADRVVVVVTGQDQQPHPDPLVQ